MEAPNFSSSFLIASILSVSLILKLSKPLKCPFMFKPTKVEAKV